jgi:hypothetical protein
MGPGSVNPSVNVTVEGKLRGVLVRKLVADAWPAPEPDRLPSHFTGWTLAGEYRPVPSHPNYEVSLAGRCRQIETLREVTIYANNDRDRVWLNGRRILLQTLINEAWPECAREPVRTRRKYLGDGEYMPLPTYPEGRIVSLHDYCRDLERSRN